MRKKKKGTDCSRFTDLLIQQTASFERCVLEEAETPQLVPLRMDVRLLSNLERQVYTSRKPVYKAARRLKLSRKRFCLLKLSLRAKIEARLRDWLKRLSPAKRTMERQKRLTAFIKSPWLRLVRFGKFPS